MFRIDGGRNVNTRVSVIQRQNRRVYGVPSRKCTSGGEKNQRTWSSSQRVNYRLH